MIPKSGGRFLDKIMGKKMRAGMRFGKNASPTA